MYIKLTSEFIENVKANDANVIETLRSLYDEIVYDAKNEYKFHGLVDMDAHMFTGELGMVYVDKDDEIFYENSIHPTDFTGVSPDKYYSKKHFSIVAHFPGIFAIADYACEYEEFEIIEWFEKEVVNQLTFISFEDFVEALIIDKDGEE